jgi:putative acetyltransferase
VSTRGTGEADPEGVTIRTQRPDDRQAVQGVIVRAFGRAVVADLADSLYDTSEQNAGLAFVAERDATVVGHVQLSWSWLDAPDRLVDVLVLSPLSVLPEHQGNGIGGRLVRHAIAAAEDSGAPMVFLEGSPDYYERFGFEAARGRGFSAPSVRIPDAAFQVVTLVGYQPWMTGALVYADAFWAHDCVGLRPQPADNRSA